jgi:hypothetical protein
LKWFVKIQGDQIWRLFAYWVIDFFCAVFLKITEVVQILGLFFSGETDVCIRFDKNGFGYILCDFFTNSSDDPVRIYF